MFKENLKNTIQTMIQNAKTPSPQSNSNISAPSQNFLTENFTLPQGEGDLDRARCYNSPQGEGDLDRARCYHSPQGEGDNLAIWQEIVPDAHNDWIKQRNNSFDEFLPMGDKKNKNSTTIFKNYSQGVQSIKDDICFNFSKEELVKNIKNYKYSFEENQIMLSLYRPFNKNYFCYNRSLNHRQGQMKSIFPNNKIDNLVICLTGIGIKEKFSTLISREIPEYHFQKNGQTFPLYLYEKTQSQISSQDLRVEKMKFAKNGKETDKTTIIYNNKITLKNIPLQAFDYEVNGKSAIEWDVDRQCVSINADSQIKNDANDFAIYTKNNPAYIIELLQSIITTSLKTIEITNKISEIVLAT